MTRRVYVLHVFGGGTWVRSWTERRGWTHERCSTLRSPVQELPRTWSIWEVRTLFHLRCQNFIPSEQSELYFICSTSHAIFLCSWDLEIWHRAATPNRSIWELLHLRIAPFENRSIWELLHLRNAPFEKCSIWEMLHLRNMRMKTNNTFWEGCNFNQDGQI